MSNRITENNDFGHMSSRIENTKRSGSRGRVITRRGPYKRYSKTKVLALMQNYFIHKMTVKESSIACQMNLSTAYKYINVAKKTEVPGLIEQVPSNYEKAMKALCCQFESMKTL